MVFGIPFIQSSGGSSKVQWSKQHSIEQQQVGGFPYSEYSNVVFGQPPSRSLWSLIFILNLKSFGSLQTVSSSQFALIIPRWFYVLIVTFQLRTYRKALYSE